MNETIYMIKSHNDFVIKLVNDAINDYCDTPEMGLKWLHRNHPAFTYDIYMNQLFSKIFETIKNNNKKNKNINLN